ncbi:peptidase c45 acyl-coenzyme a:6-aminopenicillanic acid acyl-transferase [Nitratireductor aquibiodomus RA22]|uniref:Peptidase c45 acyl-coenzyme a:6-aminopenicillanic acid acyl-transferase n=1 Tax=Nitratireductor aquibiodomus RA22 TaxID=1189611 RepID=I5BVE4_9HYPH|nr:peptidase c45 acyl-coenzyme a:6-aminopenicillanic acid acyl-transferase [Nitratireductor aquibiodomus RA22]
MRTVDLPVIDCPALPRERGRAHGEGLREAITDKITRWRRAIPQAYGIDAEVFLPRFLEGTNFHKAIARHAPDLMEEIEGIAEGAGVAPETIYAMQLMDEEWWFGSAFGDGHCSSIAVAPGDGQTTLVAQTMDLPYWHDGAQALLRMDTADGGELLVFTSAGMLGLLGVSGGGLAFASIPWLSFRRTQRAFPSRSPCAPRWPGQPWVMPHRFSRRRITRRDRLINWVIVLE